MRQQSVTYSIYDVHVNIVYYTMRYVAIGERNHDGGSADCAMTDVWVKPKISEPWRLYTSFTLLEAL